MNKREFSASSWRSNQGNFNLFESVSKNSELPSFIEIRAVGAELLHADGRMDEHEEANSCFSHFDECD